MQPKAKELTKDIIIPYLRKMWGFSVSTDLTLLSGGTESAAWVVEEGNGGNKWVAKVFGLGEGLNKIKDEVSLYHFLNGHEIHAPVLKPDLDGQELDFIDFKGYKFPIVIMRFENLRMCTPSTVTQGELTKIAIETAKMHKVLLEYPNKEILKNYILTVEHIKAIEFYNENLLK